MSRLHRGNKFTTRSRDPELIISRSRILHLQYQSSLSLAAKASHNPHYFNLISFLESITPNHPHSLSSPPSFPVNCHHQIHNPHHNCLFPPASTCSSTCAISLHPLPVVFKFNDPPHVGYWTYDDDDGASFNCCIVIIVNDSTDQHTLLFTLPSPTGIDCRYCHGDFIRCCSDYQKLPAWSIKHTAYS